MKTKFKNLFLTEYRRKPQYFSKTKKIPYFINKFPPQWQAGIKMLPFREKGTMKEPKLHKSAWHCFESIILRNTYFRGSWMAHSVQRPTLAQVMISQSVSWSPPSGSVLIVQSLEPALDSVFPSLSAPPLLMLCLSLSQKWIKIFKKEKETKRSFKDNIFFKPARNPMFYPPPLNYRLKKKIPTSVSLHSRKISHMIYI